MEKLRDIKDIVEVPDHSLAILLGLITLALLIIAVGLYLFKNRRRRRKKPTVKEIAFQRLNSIDYNNAKEVVYIFEAEVEAFLNEQNRKIFNELKEELKIYKYKKDIPPLDEQRVKKIKRFIKGLK